MKVEVVTPVEEFVSSDFSIVGFELGGGEGRLYVRY